jgi:aryl-alcohol dehydrogenase-like predicted oxidoreductase
MSESTNQRAGLPGWSVGVAWAVTAILSYLLAGDWLAGAIEGLDPALVSKMPMVVVGVAVLASLVLTVVWARGLAPVAASAESGSDASGGRRRFLLGLGAVGGGVVATAVAAFARISGWVTVVGPNIQPETPFKAQSPRPEWAGARVMEYRRLGRTGFEVSDISLGSTRIKGEQGERVARMAIERGVNYFDTAPDYSETGSELALGKAMKGHRDKMFLATKFCTPHGHLPPGSPVQASIEAVEASLRRLQTDYVDLVHVHACDSAERLLDENTHEAFDRLKEQGKARFIGFSSHTPHLEQVADAAIDSGRIDVMMLAYHHGAWPRQAEIIRRAHQAGVGVVAMKTLKGALHQGLLEDRAEADSYTQAAFKWVLGNPDLSCLVISFREPSNVDEYLHASGKRPTAADHALLQRYDQLIAGRHCRQHCGACLGSCPEAVPIDDVLRHRMYFESYGDEKQAMQLYARLGQPASACLSCSAPCLGSCPFGISIAQATREAHRLLTLS